MMHWILQRTGKSALISLGLLVFTMGSAVWGLSKITKDLEIIPFTYVMIIALLTGWLLARSRQRGWSACLLAILSGLIWFTVRFGELLIPMLALLKAWLAFSRNFWRFDLNLASDFSPVLLSLQEIGTILTQFYGHIYDWIIALVQRHPQFDPQVTAFVWSLLVWLCCIWAAWVIRRHGQALAAICPIGVILVVAVNLAQADAQLIIPFTAAGLSLMVMSTYLNNENGWKLREVDYPEDIPIDLAMISGLIIGAFIVFAYLVIILPDISIHNLVNRINPSDASGGGNDLASSFGLEKNTQRPSVLIGFTAPGLPREHLLGAGPELSQKVVMVVEDQSPSSSGPTPSTFPDPGAAAIPSYHWRSLTYDQYTGRGWSTSQTTDLDYPSGIPVIPAQLPERVLLEQQIRFIGDTGGLLYAAGELLSVDQDFEAAWRHSPDVSNQEIRPFIDNRSVQDFLALEYLRSADLFGVHLKAKTYTVRSLLLSASLETLRQAGSNYPPQIASTYLSLPEALPQRVRDLSGELTSGYETPYDKAAAIESFLHQLPYTLDIGPPPADRDVSDYFLFDLKKGYCDYYATAMVVLSRASGLPARLVVGYAGGSYDPANQRYIITEANAHSWVEIYFSGLGWVEFEPTPGLPAFEHPDIDLPGALASLPPEIFSPQSGPSSLTRWILPVAASVLLLAAFFGFFLLARRRSGSAPAQKISSLYRRMRRQGSRLTDPFPPGTTPREFAAALWHRLLVFSQQPFILSSPPSALHNRLIRERILTPAEPEIESITDLYNQAAYSQHPASYKQIDQAIRAWSRLRWRLWFARLFPRKNA